MSSRERWPLLTNSRYCSRKGAVAPLCPFSWTWLNQWDSTISIPSTLLQLPGPTPYRLPKLLLRTWCAMREFPLPIYFSDVTTSCMPHPIEYQNLLYFCPSSLHQYPVKYQIYYIFVPVVSNYQSTFIFLISIVGGGHIFSIFSRK